MRAPEMLLEFHPNISASASAPSVLRIRSKHPLSCHQSRPVTAAIATTLGSDCRPRTVTAAPVPPPVSDCRPRSVTAAPVPPPVSDCSPRSVNAATTISN
ncbi:unnamed protein product [Cuscuta epithymum]|uniref:Uncharacterized protein n=1 Tax=Cuscuta epithymum TaxID=186058 RepID=A0AAV0EK83_9ASTE|nr:unnamed protein product [Cuscuta epithymum]